ncbi:CFS1-like protein [Auricularia subglabra TFB-10046 SS5]|uniref:CFS1-like protein n=1 Tax=Auricularia subglabra (strain TFB-10046 / SS5) TaxID=717982 RepID=J0WU45_AURST|nr:CFS1-like protein [Auricularia subglabra TFB-10046 SS5]
MAHQQLVATSSYSLSFATLADSLLGSVRDAIFQSSFLPLASFAESAVVATLQQLEHGQLRVVKQDGLAQVFPPGTARPGPSAELHVVRDAFWLRLACMGGLGFAEAFMFGDVKCDAENLRNVFKIFLLNRENMDRIEGTFARAFSAIPNYLTATRFANALGITRGNISAHYDISNRMFEGFLSRDMMYSSAIFEDVDADLSALPSRQRAPARSHVVSDDCHDVDELHEGQLRKIRHILRRLKIKPGHRILEVGTGWGEFAICAVQSVPGFDCTVESITLSSEQKALAEQRIAEAGLSDKIRVHLLDYRALPKEWEGTFDRFVSIEMIEHVGLNFLPTYFGVVHWALKKRDAVGVIQVSTMPETRVEAYEHSVDFIQKYVIFPGCFLPTVTQLVQGIHKGSQAKFIVDTVDNVGPHYPRTLREWAKRFDGCFDDVIAPELRKQYPDGMKGGGGKEELQIFRRKWLCNYYCEAGFQSRTLGNHTVSFVREASASYGCNLEASSI